MGDSGSRINSDNMDMVRGKDAREFYPRVRFKDTVCRLSHGADFAKTVDAECLVGQKIDWSLSQEREFMGVRGNKIAVDKKWTKQ